MDPHDKTTFLHVRVTQTQRETFNSMGGAKWLRDMLDRLHAPPTTNGK